MHSFTYSPSHLRLIRRLNGVECKQIVPDTLSALSEYGLLRYRGKRAGLKRIIHQIGSSHSAGNGAAVILGNSVIVQQFRVRRKDRAPGKPRSCSYITCQRRRAQRVLDWK